LLFVSVKKVARNLPATFFLRFVVNSMPAHKKTALKLFHTTTLFSQQYKSDGCLGNCV